MIKGNLNSINFHGRILMYKQQKEANKYKRNQNGIVGSESCLYGVHTTWCTLKKFFVFSFTCFPCRILVLSSEELLEHYGKVINIFVILPSRFWWNRNGNTKEDERVQSCPMFNSLFI